MFWLIFYHMCCLINSMNLVVVGLFTNRSQMMSKEEQLSVPLVFLPQFVIYCWKDTQQLGTYVSYNKKKNVVNNKVIYLPESSNGITSQNTYKIQLIGKLWCQKILFTLITEGISEKTSMSHHLKVFISSNML